jgi:hypothetical protein
VTNNCRLICRVPFSCCDSVAWPQETVLAPAWAPRSRTCDRSYVQRPHLVRSTSPRVLPCLCAHEAGNVAPRATASAPRSSTCNAQGMELRAAAWAPRLSTCDKQLPRATALPPRSGTCVAPRASAWVPRLIAVPSVCACSKQYSYIDKTSRPASRKPVLPSPSRLRL